jgi:murein DD-endopeptidase MepM/ murein hydrolase activator NlpD
MLHRCCRRRTPRIRRGICLLGNTGGIRRVWPGNVRRRVAALLLCCIVLFPAATQLHADDITSAQQQLKQVTAQRSNAEQQLASAKQEIANLNLQLQSNRNQLAAVQQQTAALQREASSRESNLNGDLSALLTELQTARSRLNTEQQQFQAQQGVASARLQQDQDDLRSAQSQLRAADQQRLSTERDATALAAQLQAMDADIATRTQQIAAVLVQLYKFSQTSALSLILNSGNMSDGLNRLTMLGMVSQHDQDLMVQLANERDLARQQHQVLTADLATTQQLEAELTAERENISLRASDEEHLIQQVETELTQAQASFQQQAATLDAEIGATQQKITANRQQFAANRAPLLAKQATLASTQHGTQAKLSQAQQQAATAEQEIAKAEQDQQAATNLIQQLQAAAAKAAAAEQARELAAQQAAAARQHTAPPPAPSGGLHFIWPVQGPITQPFGPTSWTMEPPGHGYAHFHTGLDIAAGYGTPVHAAAAGVVIHVGWFSGANWGYGNCIIIVHNGTYSTLYGHLSGYAVSQNQYVQQGQVIGYEGSTGNSSGPHVHFEVRVNGEAVNPLAYL